MEAIGRWAVERGIWVITDEIYEHLTYGEHRFSSMPTLVPELRDRCVVLNGVAKTYAMTGLARRVDDRARGHHQGGHQPAVALHVERRQRQPAGRAGRRVGRPQRGRGDAGRLRASGPARCTSSSTGIDGVTSLEPQGAFYAFPNLSHYLGRPIRGRTSSTTVELCSVLLDEAKVAIVPGEAFDAPGYARLSFALGDDDLGEGCRRIADLLAEAE